MHVRENRVDYQAIKSQPEALKAYLESLAKVSEAEFNQWSENEQLSYLINLYNAATIQLIVDHFPVKSIKSIGGIRGPWKLEVVEFFGKKINLGDLEHEVIRKRYKEPRIHFALVCAALGCPPLRGEAYVADQLDGQLDDQAKLFLAEGQKKQSGYRK